MITILTSDSYRHRFLVKILSKSFKIDNVICEEKGDMYYNEQRKSKVIKKHFENLLKYEKEFFGNDYSFLNNKIKYIKKGEINSKEIVNSINSEILILFGTSILNELWLSKFDKIINIHLGLSPFYRGSATLFWPFVNDELECVGATIHYAIKKVDAGGILKRIKPDIEIGDNYYTITNKTIKKTILELVNVINNLDNINPVTPEVMSKVCKKSDFNESVLKKVLDKYSYIDKKILEKIKKSTKCQF